MSNAKIIENLKEGVNSPVVLRSIIFGLISWIISYFMRNVSFMVSTLFASISSMFILTVIWEIIAKKSFAEQLIALVNISENIIKSGIETTYENFKTIQWDQELRNAKSIKVVMTYSTKWGSSGNNKEIIKKLKSDGCLLEIFLPNPEIEDSIRTLNIRFDFPKSEMQIDTSTKINEAIRFYDDLGFDVYLYNGVFQNSYYMIDNVAFMSFFNHKKPQGMVTFPVPAIKAVNDGEFYSYISGEIEAIKTASQKYIRSV